MFPSSLYESIFTSSPIGMYLLSTTPEVTVLDVNDSFLHTVSLKREDMIGKSLFEVFPDNQDDPQDTGIEALRTSIAKAVATGETQLMPVQRFPIQRLLPNGQLMFEERFWRATNTPIFDATGKMICVSHTTIEITKQVQAEMALRESERQAMKAAERADAERQRLDAVLEAVPVGIAVAEADGALVLVNPENRRIWGNNLPLSSSVAEYREWKGWWADESPRHGMRVAPSEWPLARALRGETAPRDLIKIEPFDSPAEHRTAFTCGAPIRNKSGNVIGAVVAVMDITDRVRAEQAVKEASQRKDEFLAMLAHELRNPLAPIGTAAHLIKMAGANEHQVQNAANIIVRQVKHMTELVNDLLDVSRVTRGLVALAKEPVDIKSVIGNAIEQVLPLIEARHHTMQTRLGSDNARVCGDRTRLIQVFVNLITNAAKYTPQGGHIEIGLDVFEQEVKVCITDNGNGIEPNLLPHIFNLFTQGRRTPDRSQGGLGLGLALVKSLVALHNGRIEVHSQVGKGSTFSIHLPIIDREAHRERRSTLRRGVEKSENPVSIMIVDDNVDAAESLGSLLEAQGHRVVVKSSAQNALMAALAAPPQVFILDIGLPDMDGYELAKRLLADAATANAIYIALTGYGQAHDKELAKAAGFHHHFVKPMEIDTLTNVLAGVQTHRNKLPLEG